MKKTGILTLLIAVTGMLLSGCSGNPSEKTNELADLQGMRGAELTAMMRWKDSLPEGTTEYWYDPNSFELIPASEPMPDAHGFGKKGKGSAIEAFETDTGLHYEYDEGTDYTGKVIHVTVNNRDGALEIKVDWVDAA